VISVRLILKKIKLENFKMHKNTVIEFSEGINIFQGRNGTGKSSVLEAIFAALYLGAREGQFPRRYSDLVNYESSNANIELEFDVIEKNVTYECLIKRIIDNRGNSKVELRITKKFPDGTIKREPLITKVGDAIERITRLLGMDAKEFMATVYIRQREITSILDKEILTQIFNKYLKLEDYDVALQNLSRILNTMETSIADINEKIVTNEMKLRNYRSRVEALKRAVDHQMKKKSEYEKDREHIESTIKTLEKLDNIASDLKQIIESIKYIKKFLEDYEEKTKQVAQYETSNIEEEFQKISLKFEKYNQLEIEEKGLRTHVKALSNEIENLNSELTRIEEQIRKMDAYEKELKNIMSSLKGFSIPIPENLTHISELISDFESIKRAYSNVSIVFSRLKDYLTEICDVKALPDFILEFEKILSNINEEIEDLKENIAKLRSNLGAIRGEISSKKEHVRILEDGLKEGLVKCPVCGREFNSEDEAKSIVENYKNDIMVLTEKENDIKEKIENLNKRLFNREKLRDELIKAKNDVLKLREKDIEDLNRLNEIVTLLKRLHEISSEIKKIEPYKDVLLNIKKKIEERINEREGIEKRLKEVIASKKNIDNYAIAYGYENIKQLYQDIFKKFTRYQELRREIITKRKEYEMNKNELVELEKRKEVLFSALKSEIHLIARTLDIDPSEIHLHESDIKSLIEKIREKKTLFESRLKEIEERIQKITSEIERMKGEIRVFEEHINELKREIETLKEDKEILENLRVKFKKEILEKIREARGVIIQDVAQRVSIIASDYFRRFLHNKNYSVILKVEAPSGRQEQIIKVSPIVIKPVGNAIRETGTDSISGGEEVALAISLRLAISMFLGYSIGLLILDEPTPHLDTENVQKLKDLIRGLRETLHASGFQVIIVTHHDTLTEIEDAKIFRFDVARDQRGSIYSKVTSLEESW